MVKARGLLKPTWRNEAQSALFQRALAIGANGIGMRAGLSHAEIGSIVAVQRLESGETNVLRRRAWGRVRADQRFTLLMQLMVNLETGRVIPTEARLDDVVTAVLGMADATRDVLALHLVTHLGRFPAMTSAVLDRISDMKGNWKDEILVALARVHALRGNSAKAQELMKLSQSTSEERLREKALERLRCLLNCSASVPAEPVGAVLSALATVSAPDLPAAMKLCLDHLPEIASEFVVADVIARGRAADAFSSTLY
jgi:hypothetical protein